MKKFSTLTLIVLAIFGNIQLAVGQSPEALKKMAINYYLENNFLWSSHYAEYLLLSKKSIENIDDITFIYIESKKNLGEEKFAVEFLSPKISSSDLLFKVKSYIYNDDQGNDQFQKNIYSFNLLKDKPQLTQSDIEFYKLPKVVEELDNKYNKKNPWLAAGMSAIVPGLGQVYNGNYQSAAVAFIFNSLLIFTTLEFQKNDLTWPALTSGFLFSLTYVGNIVSSGKDAVMINNLYNYQRNQELKKHFLPEFNLSFEF